MNNPNGGNVGIVIVSHSPKIAEGAADMVRQMVGNACRSPGPAAMSMEGSARMLLESWRRSRRRGPQQVWLCSLISVERRQIPRWRWKCWLKIEGRASSSAMLRWSKER